MLYPLRWSLAFACVLFAFASTSSRADLIFLKDGHVLQGTVRREGIHEFDPVSRESTFMPKGFFLLDDGPRRIYFSPSQVRIVEKLPPPTEERVVSHNHKLVLNPRNLPPHLEVLEAGKWDLKTWERSYAFRSTDAPKVGLRQGIGMLSPYYIRLDAVTKFRWNAGYLTREWEPETVIELLESSPSLQAKKDDTPPQIVTKRLRICDFLAQAGWYDHAYKKLDGVLREFPDQKERIDSARAMLDKLRLREEWELIKNWYQAGRLNAVGERLTTFPTNHVTDRIQADIREMKARIRHSSERIEQANKALDDIANTVESDNGKFLAKAIVVLKRELHESTIDKLDAFLGQVQEAQRQKGRGIKPALGPDQLLSLAVTGWLLGSSSAEAKTEVGVNLWKSREMVLAYLREGDAPVRKKLLEKYLAEVTPRVDIDEVAQMISTLPPIDPASDVSPQVLTLQVATRRQPVNYLVKLPPEYTHNRTYPVLIAVHNIGEKPDHMIQRYAKYAADYGYILVAPGWGRLLSDEYSYTDREQETVFATLTDLKRRFRVDCDRVFLTGYAEGAKMAFDVSLSQPHLFAGVLPMAAGPNLYPRRYWRNGQYVSFYCINGTRGSDSQLSLKDQFNNWAIRGYPAIWIEYKGRGTEFFRGEVPMMFDWMRHQRRAFPMRELGSDGGGTNFGNEFCTLRAEDNRFYWLSSSNISSRHLVSPGNFNNLVDPATLTGRIEPTTNEIMLKTRGVNDVTVWLGRNSAGQYMIDFEKPLTIRVGLQTYFANRRVTPSLEVLLEDLFRRGDRKQLYLAKVELTLR